MGIQAGLLNTDLNMELSVDQDALVAAPDWLPDLILYEVATKGFTSPDGPESGTFASLRARLPYLHDLGVTGIWLTGHSLADSDHFYNIWTQYAVIQPDEFDPTLGTAEDFRALVDAAHNAGIKVILEVVTHGVMPYSLLVAAKPHWFKGGSWRMTDYDWAGRHTDLDDWWVDLWVKMVEEYGVDGFRLDVAAYRWDLWQRVRQRAAAIGHPIVLVNENTPGCQGVIDFLQRCAYPLSNQRLGLIRESPFLHDVANFIHKATQPHSASYTVQIEYVDGSAASSDGADCALNIAANWVQANPAHDGDGRTAYIRHLVNLEIEGASSLETIQDVIVTDAAGQEWHYLPWVDMDCLIEVKTLGERLWLAFPEKYPPGHWLSLQLSSHDTGWDGFPLGMNPYVAQGSRFVFGYGFLLTPCVPLFMAGEEFNAGYRPLPQLSPRLFGGERFGEGRWLYGSWLQWEQLEEPEHAEMLEDVRRLIQLRKQFAHLIHPLRVGESSDHIVPVVCVADYALPVPYLYRSADECLLIAGTQEQDQDVPVRFQLPAEVTGWTPSTQVVVADVWQASEEVVCSVSDLEQKEFLIPRDKVARGGLLVLHLRRS